MRDTKTPFYPSCKEKYTLLFTVLMLLQFKATHRWSDSSFKALLHLLKDMLPKGNKMPKTVYDAEKIVCPLELEVEKIHTCKADCILFRREYAELDQCPICETHQYKCRNDDSDMEEDSKRKEHPRRVMWYFPIIPRLKYLFQNKKESQLLRWHKEGRKNDAMIEHPADSA